MRLLGVGVPRAHRVHRSYRTPIDCAAGSARALDVSCASPGAPESERNMKPLLFLLGIAALTGCGKSTESSQTAPGYDFSPMRAELFDNAWKTEGVVVLHEGKIVFEEYAEGWNDST